MKKTILLTLAAFGLAAGAHAQTIINADPADDEFVLMDPSADTRRADQDSSAGWNNGTARSTVFLFELTNISNTITDADFTTYFRQISDNQTGADIANTDVSLFATTLNGKTLSNDFFITPQDLGGSNITVGSVEWTSIQSVFVDGANVPGSSKTDPAAYSLDSGGGSNLVSFLNDYYTGGFTSGDYLAIGLALDTNGETYGGSGNFKFDFYPTSTGQDGDGDLTSLSITAIPEPSTFALLAGALGLGLVMLRRRR